MLTNEYWQVWETEHRNLAFGLRNEIQLFSPCIMQWLHHTGSSIPSFWEGRDKSAEPPPELRAQSPMKERVQLAARVILGTDELKKSNQDQKSGFQTTETQINLQKFAFELCEFFLIVWVQNKSKKNHHTNLFAQCQIPKQKVSGGSQQYCQKTANAQRSGYTSCMSLLRHCSWLQALPRKMGTYKSLPVNSLTGFWHCKASPHSIVPLYVVGPDTQNKHRLFDTVPEHKHC